MAIDLTDLMDAEHAAPIDARIWSPMQKAIFHVVEYGTGNIIVQAVAGSGKTTTILKSLEYIPYDKKVLLLAFNKAIADNLRNQVPSYVQAKTFHSLGCLILRNNGHTDWNVVGQKTRKALKDNFPQDIVDDLAQALIKLVSTAKANMLGCHNEQPADLTQYFVEAVEGLQDEGIGQYQPHQVATIASRLYRICLSDTRTIDFDDMLFLPFYLKCEFPQYDFVLADEAQDLNPIQHEMVYRLTGPNGRVVAVGDRSQAIYAFRGADSRSMDNMKHMFNAEELPLSVSYRCPIAVVEQAQMYVEEIQPKEDAELGICEDLTEPPPVTSFLDTDMVVCRNNAPIFSLAMQFVRERLPVQVKSNLEKTIQTFINLIDGKYKCNDDIDKFIEGLNNWFQAELTKAELEGREAYMQTISDRYDTIRVLAQGEDVATVTDMLILIKKIFRSGRGPTLCTIHKAKGLEAPRVFIWRPDLIPSRFAKTNSALQQEDNLLYVAITRSLEELYFVYLPED